MDNAPENKIDPGIVEVALALSAAAAFLATSEVELVVRIVSVIGFATGTYAAGTLAWNYVAEKDPELNEIRSTSKLGWISLVPEGIKLNFISLLSGKSSESESRRKGYLNLLAAFVFLYIAIGLWVIFSFFSIG